VNYEAGARWSKSGLRIEAIGFFNDYSNLTSLCTNSSGCSFNQVDTQFSAGRAHIYGVEAFIEKTFRWSRVTIPLSLAYTFTKTQLLSSFRSADPQLGNVKAGDELPYVPPHQLNASVGIEIWKMMAHAQFNFVDRMREVAGQGPVKPGMLTDAQVTVDLNLGFKIFDWAQVYLDGRNITDNRALVSRRPFGARPNAPRTLIAGLKLTY
jgi:Fe(3+) dicitrate transport protein